MRSRSRRSAGAVEKAGDVIGGGHDGEDAHAAAALAADDDVDREDAGEERCPNEAAGPRRRGSFEAFAVAAVDGRRGVQVHPERRADVGSL